MATSQLGTTALKGRGAKDGAHDGAAEGVRVAGLHIRAIQTRLSERPSQKLARSLSTISDPVISKDSSFEDPFVFLPLPHALPLPLPFVILVVRSLQRFFMSFFPSLLFSVAFA